MRLVVITSAFGAIVGAAVFAVLDRISRFSAGNATDFGWFAYRPRRYVDYLPIPTGEHLALWLIVLITAASGAVVGALGGWVAALCGVRVVRSRPGSSASSDGA